VRVRAECELAAAAADDTDENMKQTKRRLRRGRSQKKKHDCDVNNEQVMTSSVDDEESNMSCLGHVDDTDDRHIEVVNESLISCFSLDVMC